MNKKWQQKNRSWCLKILDHVTLRMQILTDPHSPEKYRVLAPTANMPEFATAFSCGKAALRSEDKRVNIW
jgi:putative endopeptidase